MVEFAELLRERGAFGETLLGVGGQRGQPAVWRIDDDRAARDSVDANDVEAGVEPEAVVAADSAARRLGDALDERRLAWRRQGSRVAPFDGRGAIRIARLVAEFLHQLRSLLDRLRFRVGQRQTLFSHPLQWRLGFVTPVPLQIGLAVGRARHDPGFALRGRLGGRLRAERREEHRREAERQRECASERTPWMSSHAGDARMVWAACLRT